MDPLRPPRVPPVVPPGGSPGERRISYDSLLDKPDLFDGKGIKGQLYVHVLGKAPLKLQRDEETADLLTMIELRRDDEAKAFIGFDEDDHLIVLAKDGMTVLAEFDTDDSQDFAIQLHRDAGAGMLPFIALKRQTTVVGFLGTDGNDDIVFLKDDGATSLATITKDGEVLSGRLEASGEVQAPRYNDVNGDQVVGLQQPAINPGIATGGSPGGSSSTGGPPGDPATLADVDGVYTITNSLEGFVMDALLTATTALLKANESIGALRAHGLIKP